MPDRQHTLTDVDAREIKLALLCAARCSTFNWTNGNPQWLAKQLIAAFAGVDAAAAPAASPWAATEVVGLDGVKRTVTGRSVAEESAGSQP